MLSLHLKLKIANELKMFKFFEDGAVDFMFYGNQCPDPIRCRTNKELADWFKQFAKACKAARISKDE